MFYRKAIHRLRKWKEQKNSKPLIIRGARQVGKSTLATQLGSEYEIFISLNLEKSADAQFFLETDDVPQLFERILLDKNLPNKPKKTLLFIDEIQEVPKAISLLRYFYEELPELDVIAAGSLLEFAVGDVPSFPVGRVELMALHPLDFEEYLQATGEDIVLSYFQKLPIPDIAHDTLLRHYNNYILIGGMPEVVMRYVESNKVLTDLNPVYASIWDTYIKDIEKYGDNPSEKKILRHIIDTAPSVRDRISFNNFGNSSYRSREMGEAFRKLDKAGLIHLVYPTSNTDLPVALNYRRKPKIQFLDTGLLNFAAGIQTEILKIKDTNDLYRGYITNHMMTQELIAQSPRLGYIPPFWTRENANANAEVDLVVPYKNQLIPIELKSGKKGRLRSLHQFIDKSELSVGVRLLANKMNLEKSKTISGKDFTLINLPYYSVSKISEYLDHLL
jgi:predicted AAA+ superfamily ATPase